MRKHALTLAATLLLALPAAARAQGEKLAHLLPTLYGERGLFVDSAAPLPDGSTHSAHFNNVQRFSFDSIEGIDLGALPAVFTHDGAAPGGRADVVTTSSSVSAALTQQIAFLTYGLGQRVDASLAVPFAIADLSVSSDATIQRLGTGSNTVVHYYDDGTGSQGSTRRYVRAGRASGLGDLTLRLKGQAARWGDGKGLALALDLRMPRATSRTCWARAPGACGRSRRRPSSWALSFRTSTSATSGTAGACWPATWWPASRRTWPTSWRTRWGPTSPWAGA
jgi:hypothetical protein